MTTDATSALRALIERIGEVEAMRKKAAAQAEHREWFLTHNHARELAYHFIRDHGDELLAALTADAADGVRVPDAKPCCPPEDLSDYIHVTVLRDQLSRHAEPECRECDGQGLYMGNVCVCNCITDTLASRAPTAEGTREGGEGEG